MNATSDTTLITMGENTRIEDLTLSLTSNAHHNLVGINLPGTTSVTSKVRTCVLTVNNSTASQSGSSNVYGVLSNGTGSLGNASFSFNSLKGSTINVYSNGGGTKRGILINSSNVLTVRDLNIYVAPPTDLTSTGSYIGCETNDPGNSGSIQFRTSTLGTQTPAYVAGPTGTIQLYTSSDILQSTPAVITDPTYLASPGIQIGPGTDLVTKTAGGKGFSTYIYPTTVYFGLKGSLTGGTNGWLWPGTQAVSTSFPDPSGVPATKNITISGVNLSNEITVNSTVGLAVGMPIVFSGNYGYIKEGAVITVGNTSAQPYYIKTVGVGYIKIGTYIAGVLTEFTTGVYSGSQVTASVYTTTISITSVTSNSHLVSATLPPGLLNGMIVVFQNIIDATVSAGTVYYIRNVTSNYITISDTFGGPVKAITNGTVSPAVTGNVVTVSSSPANYRAQQPAILSGMAASLSIGADSNTVGATVTVEIYRTPSGSDLQFGICKLPLYTFTFTGTDLTKTYYSSSHTFSQGDRIHAYVSYTGATTAHDLTLQLDMF